MTHKASCSTNYRVLDRPQQVLVEASDLEENAIMQREQISRREFVREGTAAAIGVTVGLGMAENLRIVAAGTEPPPEVKNTRSYNSKMEYRRLGKTGLWVSAVCLGGHWKRIDKIINAKGTIDPYAGPTDGRRHGRLSSRIATRSSAAASKWAST